MDPPGAPYRLALVGFGEFERHALETCFRLAGPQAVSFDPAATLEDCRFCVVDADRPEAVEAVRAAARVRASVFVGGKAPEDAGAHLTRPIDPRRVARALEALVQALHAQPQGLQRGEAAHAPTATPPTSELVPRRPRARRRKPDAAASAAGLPVLVVEDCDIARRFLSVQLEQLGCRVAEAADARAALTLLSQRRFRIVFADLDMPGMDGLQLCQEVKHGGSGAPAVVMVGGRDSAVDRVRGSLAGCDGYLTKPLDAAALASVLNATSERRRLAR